MSRLGEWLRGRWRFLAGKCPRCGSRDIACPLGILYWCRSCDKEFGP